MAMRYLQDYAKRILHLHQLYAIVDSENYASLNLFRKCGFSGDIVLKNWLYDGEKYKKSIFLQFFL